MQNMDMIILLIVSAIIGWTFGLLSHFTEKRCNSGNSSSNSLGALELAKYIVVKCIQDKRPITNLQLQKMLYYVQQKFWQKLGRPAFSEVIEEWGFGPVVPSVYYYFCGAGAMPISLCGEPATALLPEEDRRLIDSIIESKRELKPWELNRKFAERYN